MSSLGFLFPGQGSQFVGMAADLYQQFDIAKQRMEEAEDILSFPLREICFEGPEENLRQTRFTQPAIFVHSLIVVDLLTEKGIKPDAVAGHSLGEYSALVSAGALSFSDALKIVQLRGELMQQSGEKQPGTMAAVIGLNPESLHIVCDEVASGGGIVVPANFNSPGQIVLSGEVEAVQQAMVLAKEKGAKLVKQLSVSGAFHSPLMQTALSGLSDALDDVQINDTHIPLYSNAEAKPVTAGAEIRELLKKQLVSAVLWENIAQNMIQDGYSRFYEVGPGKVLQGLLKRIDRSAACELVGTSEDLSRIKI